MAEEKGSVDQLVQDLKQLRDELELQIHLASADARDEWAEIEKKWEHFKARAGVVGKATEEAAEGVGEALDVVADEIKKGYERIRKLI